MNNSGSTGYGPPEDNLPSDYAGQADLFPGEVLGPYARPSLDKDLFGQLVREQPNGLEVATDSQEGSPLFTGASRFTQTNLF